MYKSYTIKIICIIFQIISNCLRIYLIKKFSKIINLNSQLEIVLKYL